VRVFEKKGDGRIFGPKGQEVAGGWRRLHNDKYVTCTLYQILLG
jgi:hypothetical protein